MQKVFLKRTSSQIFGIVLNTPLLGPTAQKIKDFFSKCEQIRSQPENNALQI